MACRNISTFTKYRVEHSTGEYFLKNTLAEKSYKKIMEETREIQERMNETFGMGLKPKNKVHIQVHDAEVEQLLSGESGWLDLNVYDLHTTSKLHEYRTLCQQ